MLAALSIGLGCGLVGNIVAEIFVELTLAHIAVGGVFYFAGTSAVTWYFTRRARDEDNRQEPP